MPMIKIKDINLYYELHGEGDPLVLLSGTGSSGEHFRVFQLPDLAKHFRVLIWDYRGTGRSDKPDMPYSTRMLAEDCVDLMKALEIERAHMLGFSMGGRIAQWIAIEQPECVASLLLLSTGPGTVSGFTFERGLPLKLCLSMIENGFEKHVRDFYTSEFLFPPEFVRKNTEVVNSIRDANLKYPTPLKPYLLHTIARQEHDTSHLLHKIECPTLIVCGSDDKYITGTLPHIHSSKALADGIKGSKFVLVEDCRHGFLWQKPEKANQIFIDFFRHHPITKN